MDAKNVQSMLQCTVDCTKTIDGSFTYILHTVVSTLGNVEKGKEKIGRKKEYDSRTQPLSQGQYLKVKAK